MMSEYQMTALQEESAIRRVARHARIAKVFKLWDEKMNMREIADYMGLSISQVRYIVKTRETADLRVFKPARD